MSNKLILITALCASLCVPKSFAHTPSQEIQLSIDDLFRLVGENSSDVKTARQSVEVSRQEENVAKSSRLPELSASLSLNYLGDATILDRDFSNVKRAKMPHFGNTLKVTAYQPIYAGGAITGAIEIAKTQTAMSELGLENTISAIRFKALECYLNLFKFRNLLKVYNENIALTEKLIENMRANSEQGVVLKNDITRYELRLSTLKYDLTTVKNNIHIMNHDLISYLRLKPESSVIPDQSLLSISLPIEGVEIWQSTAQSQSLAIKQVNKEHDLALQNNKIIKSQRLPHIGLIAGNTFDGPITVEIPPIDKNLNYWWVGVNISYNISSLFKTNKNINKSKLDIYRIREKREATSDEVARNIEQAYTLYTQAHEQLKTQQKNVELATENYRVVDRRFNNQLALLTDMLDASTSKLDAEVRLVNAHISTIYFYYQLKFISGTL